MENIKDTLKYIIQVMQVIVLPFMMYIGLAVVDLKQNLSIIQTRMEMIPEVREDVKSLKRTELEKERETTIFYQKYGGGLEWARQNAQRE